MIETIGIVALIGMLLSLCAATLNRAYQVHHTTLNAFRELEQVNFWVDRFRTDAHQAIACDLDAASPRGVSPRGESSQPGDQTQELKLIHRGGSSVKYSVGEGQLFRVVEREGKTLTREVLYAPPLAEVEWTLDERGQLPVVSCQLVFTDAESAMQPLVWWARLPSLEAHLPEGDDDGR